MFRWGVVAFSLSWAACGGVHSSRAQAYVTPSDAPTWVHKGSRVERGVIFGVGAVSGVANKSLAFDTARNRGRAEITRILSVYSASLMKDYQSSVSGGGSEETQASEQVIRTYSAGLLSGTEQRDSWRDSRSNTLFVLMVLDFERSKAAAARSAAMGDRMRRWVEENEDRILAELEDDVRPAEPKVSPPSSKAPPVSAEGTPPTPVGSGAKPSWVEGACDKSRYLCGVGDGPTPTDADVRARTALALIFKANIQSVAESFQEASRVAESKTGEKWKEVERVSDHSMVSTDKVLPMSEISQRWSAPKGRVWSLALIDRAKASVALRDKLGELDRFVANELEKARQASSQLEKFRPLRSALGALAERDAVEADLRVLSQDGRGATGRVSWRDVLALLNEASSELSFGLSLSGEGADQVQACLEEALTARGHELSNVELVDSSSRLGVFDVLIEGQLRLSSRGAIAGSQVVQATLTLRLKNGRTGRTLRTISGRHKASRGTKEAAAQTAAYKVCTSKAPAMIRDIDRYFGR